MLGVAALLIVAGVGLVWQISRLRGRVQAIRQPLTSLAQYRTSLSAGASPLVRAEWTDCPICACATIDQRADIAVCGICDWEHARSTSPGELARARENFAAYGTVNSPEELRQWGGSLPGTQIRAAKQAAVDACKQAREGALSFHEALEELYRQERLIRAASGSPA
jgi:hypothetical protein